MKTILIIIGLVFLFPTPRKEYLVTFETAGRKTFTCKIYTTSDHKADSIASAFYKKQRLASFIVGAGSITNDTTYSTESYMICN